MHSLDLQLTTAGQNITLHCRSGLSLTAPKLHFSFLLLRMHKLWICCYPWGLHHLHVWREGSWARWWTGTSQKDPKPYWFAWLLTLIRPVLWCAGESNILGGMIHLKNKRLGNALPCSWMFFNVGPPGQELLWKHTWPTIMFIWQNTSRLLSKLYWCPFCTLGFTKISNGCLAGIHQGFWRLL